MALFIYRCVIVMRKGKLNYTNPDNYRGELHELSDQLLTGRPVFCSLCVHSLRLLWLKNYCTGSGLSAHHRCVTPLYRIPLGSG